MLISKQMSVNLEFVMNNVACNLDKKVSDLLSNTTAYKFSFILLLLVDAQFDRDVQIFARI